MRRGDETEKNGMIKSVKLFTQTWLVTTRTTGTYPDERADFLVPLDGKKNTDILFKIRIDTNRNINRVS